MVSVHIISSFLKRFPDPFRLALILVIYLFSLSTAYAQLEQGLLLQYDLNGNFLDSSPNDFDGNGYNGTFVNNDSGNPQGALSANGSNTYVQFPNTPVLKPNFPITMAIRVKFDYLDGSQIVAATDFGVSTHSGSWIQVSSADQLVASFGNAGGGFNGSSRHGKHVNYSLQADTWYFIVAIFRGYQDIDIYIDCELQDGFYSGSAQSIGYTNAAGSLCRKRGNPGSVSSPHYLSGDIDHFRYWNRALNPEEILTLCDMLYCSGALTVQNNQGCVETGLVYNFELTEETGDITEVLWTFSDGSTSNTLSPIKSHSSTGSFPYTVQITMDNGCVYETEGNTEIVELPEIPVLPDSITLCQGGSFLLDLSDFSEWAEILDQNGQPVTSYLFEELGIFNFDFIHACGQIEVSVEVLEANIPENPVLPDSITICQGESFILDLSDFSDWDEIYSPRGNLVTSYTFDEPGVFNFNFTYPCGQTEVSVEVFQTNTTGYLIYSGENPICENSVVEIEINEWEDIQDSATFFLDFGDGNGEMVSNTSMNNLYSDAGTYVIEMTGTFLSCEVSESLTLTVEAPINLGLDSLYEICEGELVSISFGDFNFPVYDSNGSDIEVFHSGIGGTYIFSAENACGVFSEHIEIDVTPFQPNPFSQENEICPGTDTLTIGFGSNSYMYSWETGQNTPFLNVSLAGSYSVIVIDSTEFCSAEFIFNVTDLPIIADSIFNVPEIEFCTEGNTTLTPNNLGFPYTFPDGSIGTSYDVNVPGTITVSFTDGCYEYQESIEITIEDCLCPLIVPNIFTPNGDGKNEVFNTSYSCETPIFYMSVFNRWGQQVFESNDIDIGWSGQIIDTHHESSDGVYFYLIEYAQYVDEIPYYKRLKGNVTLLR